MIEENNPAIDTTALIAELERLRRRDKLLDVSEQLANIGHCEWDFDNDCILSCSEGYARIFGMSIAEVMASQTSWDAVMQQIHIEDRENLHAVLFIATPGRLA